MGSPDVRWAVELEQKEMREEDGRHCCEVCTYKEVRDVFGYYRVSVDTEEYAGGDDKNIVDNELSGNSRVESRWSWRVGIELAEGMDEKLRGWEEEIDCDKAEHSS